MKTRFIPDMCSRSNSIVTNPRVSTERMVSKTGHLKDQSGLSRFGRQASLVSDMSDDVVQAIWLAVLMLHVVDAHVMCRSAGSSRFALASGFCDALFIISIYRTSTTTMVQ